MQSLMSFGFDSLAHRKTVESIDDLRDWFAGQAMHLFLVTSKDLIELKNGGQPDHRFMARFCYDLANAMVAERLKRKALAAQNPHSAPHDQQAGVTFKNPSPKTKASLNAQG